MADNKSSKVRESMDALSSYIENLTKSFSENNGHISDLNQFLNEIQNELNRLQRAFDTRRFFVVTIGALKAGKSTLINALTGYRVSPDGTGAETTKKCSVIMSADDEHPEGITLYRYKKTSSQELNDEKRRINCEKATRLLMDYLKGICDWNEELSDFEQQTHSLRGHGLDQLHGMDNLDYILTSSDFSSLQQFRDFMLAEIRIKVDPNKRSVLSQNVAIIDMPGLDGTVAGVDSNDEKVNPAGNPVEFIPKFSHLFLLVQSSISGLNRTTASKLKEWQAGKKSTPVYLVFNTINSKSDWWNDQSIQQESVDRQNKALAELKQQKVFYSACYTVNAAKAWESSQKDDNAQNWKSGITEDGLRKASDIEKLIEALKKDFSEQTDRIIQEDAVTGVSNALKKFIERANELKFTASQQLDQLTDERDTWDKILECLRDASKEINRGTIEAVLGQYWDEKMPEARQKISVAIQEGGRHPWLDKGKDAYTQVEQLATNVQESIRRAHAEDGFLGKLNELMKAEFKHFSDNLNGKLDELKEVLEKDRPASGECIDAAKREIKIFSVWPEAMFTKLREQYAPLTLNPVTQIDKKKLSNPISRPWFQRTLERYGIKFIDKFQHDFIQALETSIKTQMSIFCITSDEHGDCLLNSRIKEVEDYLEQTHKKRKEKLDSDIEFYRQVIESIPELIDEINKLRESCNEFERPFNI